jgi:hypothetical protein
LQVTGGNAYVASELQELFLGEAVADLPLRRLQLCRTPNDPVQGLPVDALL